MKKLLILLLFIPFFGKAQIDPDKLPNAPIPNRLVVDYTNTFSEDQKKSLENKLQSYYDKDTVQMLILVINSIKPYDAKEYALSIGRKWAIGGKKNNKGLVYLWVKDDRKRAIQLTAHLEGYLTDAESKRVLSNTKYYFKDNNFFEGTNATIDGVFSILAKNKDPEPLFSPNKNSGNNSGIGTFLIIFFFFGGIVILLVWLYFHEKSKAEKETKEREQLRRKLEADKLRLKYSDNKSVKINPAPNYPNESYLGRSGNYSSNPYRKTESKKEEPKPTYKREVDDTPTYIPPTTSSRNDDDDNWRSSSSSSSSSDWSSSSNDDSSSYGGSSDYNGGGSDDSY